MKYSLIADRLFVSFLAAWSAPTQAYINRMRELNTSKAVVDAAINAVPGLNDHQRDIIALVRSMDAADAAGRAKIKYQLKYYYKFDLVSVLKNEK